jgi:cell division protein FtsB
VVGRDTRGPSSRRSKKPTRPRRSRRRLRLLWAAVVVFVSVYFYYRPLSSYVETRRDLAAQRAEVEFLRAEKTRLERRLSVSTSLEATRREARRIGYVRPGEKLFIVKGIPEWRKARRSVGGDG